MSCYVDQDIILDLGDGREVRVAFKGSRRMDEGRVRGQVGIHAPQSVKIMWASECGKSLLPKESNVR